MKFSNKQKEEPNYNDFVPFCPTITKCSKREYVQRMSMVCGWCCLLLHLFVFLPALNKQLPSEWKKNERQNS